MLRDTLAKDRTVLANERTLLAYVRTAIMLAVSGGTVLRLLREERFHIVIGTGLIILALLVGLYGAFRFQRLARRLNDFDAGIEPQDGGDA